MNKLLIVLITIYILLIITPCQSAEILSMQEMKSLIGTGWNYEYCAKTATCARYPMPGAPIPWPGPPDPTYCYTCSDTSSYDECVPGGSKVCWTDNNQSCGNAQKGHPQRMNPGVLPAIWQCVPIETYEEINCGWYMNMSCHTQTP